MRSFLILAGLLALPLRLLAQLPQHFYYGNLHAHTAYSDGSQDSLQTGVNTPREAYFFAKQSQHFDFLGISEHNHAQAGMRRSRYALGLQQADSATVPGEFVGLFGMEWGIIANGGHVLVYGYDNLLGWEFGNYDEFVGQNNYPALWRKINARPGAFASCAHPSNTDYGNLRTGAFNPSADSALVGSAFRSGPANSTNVTYSNPSTGSYETYFRAMLARGYHIGPFYDHDNHNTTFGRTTEGRLVVLADTLTKGAILQGLRARHFYASDDWNVQVTLTLAAQQAPGGTGTVYPMGTVAQEPGTPTLALTVTDGDGEAGTLTLLRGVAGNGQQPVVVATAPVGGAALQYSDLGLATGDSAYYYALVTQPDGDKMITAPIWFRRGPVRVMGLAATLIEAVPVTVWPNPVAAGEVVTVAGPAGAAVTVLDALGRVVWAAADSLTGSGVIAVAGWPAGLYVVRVVTPAGGMTMRRLVIE